MAPPPHRPLRRQPSRPSTRAHRTLLPVAAAFAMAATPAHAGTVELVTVSPPGDGREALIVQVRFVAGPGERNVVSVTDERGVSPSGRTLLLRDAGAPVTAGRGCVAVSTTSARCLPPSSAGTELQVLTGDGEDRVADLPRFVEATVDLGAGDDYAGSAGTLIGGPGRDTLVGGTGPDTLLGGPGTDLLQGQDGDDVLSGDGADGIRGYAVADSGGTGGAADADILDGGPGADVASYAARRRVVRADLAAMSGGSGEERDRYASIEGLAGGERDDVLRGDDGDNVLMGGGGDDRIDGAGGRDRADGNAGADRVHGGAGDDELTASDATDTILAGDGADRVIGPRGSRLDGGAGDDAFRLADGAGTPVCGRGTDLITGARIDGQRLDGCERIGPGIFSALQAAVRPARVAPGVLAVALRCLPGLFEQPTTCRGRYSVALRRPGRAPLPLGAVRFTLTSARPSSARVALGAVARRALAGSRGPVLDVRLTHRASLGGFGAQQARWRVGA